MTKLGDLDLIEWVPHLFEGDEASAEIIHPLGITGSDSIEDRIGRAAHAAGLGMLTEQQRQLAAQKGLWLVPVPRHVDSVQLSSIARLCHRPRTRLTSAWQRDLDAKGERFIAKYESLANAASKRNQGVSKKESTNTHIRRRACR
jgi:hypothetical protein